MRRPRRFLLLAALAAAGASGVPIHPAGAVTGTHPRARGSTVTARPATWSPGLAAARAYAERRAGIVSFAVRAPGHATGFRSTRRVRSASVVKAMMLVAYLNRADVRGRALRTEERALLGPMIRRSDNEAADRIYALVGPGGLAGLARAAKMRAFVASPAWGGSQITAADQARFFEMIDKHVVRRHRAYAMGLLRSVVPWQRWGIGRARPAGWTLYLKGGWSPGAHAVDHQVALLTRGHRRVALAILISDSPSGAYANKTQRGVALRLLRGIDGQPEAKAGPAGSDLSARSVRSPRRVAALPAVADDRSGPASRLTPPGFFSWRAGDDARPGLSARGPTTVLVAER